MRVPGILNGRYVIHSEHFRVVTPIMPSIPPPFDALWFRLAAGLVVGLALGSFTTMLSYPSNPPKSVTRISQFRRPCTP